MRSTGHVVSLTVSPLAAQQHGLGHLLYQPESPPRASQPEVTRVPAHHVSTPTLDTAGNGIRDNNGSNENYQNQEWLLTQNIPNLASASQQFTSQAQDGDTFKPISSSNIDLTNQRHPFDPSANRRPTLEMAANRRLPSLPQDQDQYYQNLEAMRQEQEKPRSPRPLSLHFPTIPEQPQQPPLSSSQLSLNIQRNPSLLRKESVLGHQGNFARINSGRFRPIHPAPSQEIMESRNESNRVSVVRKGPIRKDGSIVVSPKSSPAPSTNSNSSDKENADLTNQRAPLHPAASRRPSDSSENACLTNHKAPFDQTANGRRDDYNDDNVFVVKGVESVNVSKVATLPRVTKRVSFTGNNTVHDVTKDEDDNNTSADMVDTPEHFIDEAATLMNLHQLDLNQRSSVVGTQVAILMTTLV